MAWCIFLSLLRIGNKFIECYLIFFRLFGIVVWPFWWTFSVSLLTSAIGCQFSELPENTASRLLAFLRYLCNFFFNFCYIPTVSFSINWIRKHSNFVLKCQQILASRMFLTSALPIHVCFAFEIGCELRIAALCWRKGKTIAGSNVHRSLRRSLCVLPPFFRPWLGATPVKDYFPLHVHFGLF